MDLLLAIVGPIMVCILVLGITWLYLWSMDNER